MLDPWCSAGESYARSLVFRWCSPRASRSVFGGSGCAQLCSVALGPVQMLINIALLVRGKDLYRLLKLDHFTTAGAI
jgi:hypothetical protein